MSSTEKAQKQIKQQKTLKGRQDPEEGQDAKKKMQDKQVK